MAKKNLTILAIDDEQENLHIVKVVLEHAFTNVRVFTALTGSSGIAIALAEDPDVILLDIVMPIMDGFEVCRRLKNDSSLKDIPVIFLTAVRTDEKSRTMGLGAGGEGFLLKPLKEAEFLAQIRVMAKIRVGRASQRREHERLTLLLEDRTLALEQELKKHRQMETSLRESELKYRNLIETTGTGYLILNSDGSVIDANKEYVRLSGHKDLPQILGRTVLEWTADYEKQRNAEAIAKCVKDGCIRNLTMDYVDSNGHVTPVEINATVEGKGKDAYIVSICRDITERRKMQERLIHSQKIEAIGRLAGGVAHDFNNIIGAIQGNAEFLKANILPEDPNQEDVDEILKAANRAAALTRQFAAFSRSQVLSPRCADLNTILAEIGKMLIRLIGEEVRLVLKPSPVPCTIKADPGQIEQVIMNIAVNARDAMPAGGTLTIETALITPAQVFFDTHPGIPHGQMVCLTASDTGLGMTDEIKKNIFDPFFTTKESGKGVGLGLSIVHGIVKQSGGEIEVASAPDAGAVFRIYFPYVKEEAAMDKAKDKDTHIDGHETVLVVDDDESVLCVTARALRLSKYTVLTAVSGAEALKLLQEHGKPVDLLLTDVAMPGMSGKQLAAEVAHRKLAAKTLFMSAYTDEIITHHGISDSGEILISKPFSHDELKKKLREVLDGPADKVNAE